MEQYTASNGIAVRLDDGYLDVKHPNAQWVDICGNYVVDALREFFRAEEDERLGRWRWPENPDYVVYPKTSGSALVLHEPYPTTVWSYDSNTCGATGAASERAARAYFDAHPEPKPAWHDAKPWETWVVTIDGMEHARTLDEDRDLRDPRYSENAWVHITDSRITAGRRIWPEENA